jgi:hypothetical protein
MERSTSEILWRGALAGAAASVPQAMIGKIEEIIFLPAGEDSNIAPRLFDRLGRMAGENPSRAQEWILGTLFHVGYGAGWGALYGFAAERFSARPVIGGTVLGAVIYGITFPRWGGAVRTGTERPPGRRSPQMTAVAWSVAVGFGIATGVIYDVLARRADRPRAEPMAFKWEAGTGDNGAGAAREGVRSLARTSRGRSANAAHPS